MPREKTEPPFCWQSKLAMRYIRAELSESNIARRAIAVYVALTEVSSDQGSPDFHVGMLRIAELSGYTRRTIEAAIKDLVHLKIIQVTATTSRAGYRDLNRYTLLSMNKGGFSKVADGPAIIAGGRAAVNHIGMSDAGLREEDREEQTTEKGRQTLPKDPEFLYQNKVQLKPKGRGRQRGEPTFSAPSGISANAEISSLARRLVRKEAPSFEEVQKFFLTMGMPQEVAESFYCHAESKNWSGVDGRSWNDWKFLANRFAANQRQGGNNDR